MIKLGITQLLTEKQAWLRGKSVGLITNHTGVDENLTQNIALLYENVKLVALFSPEHGVWGAAQDGVKIAHSAFEHTLQIYSLYSTSPLDWTELLKNIDVLIYDIQDVGVRYYTYLGTLLATLDALESDKTVVCIVADRPNPIGGIRIEGPMLNMDYVSLVGPYSIPVRYGMTLGEVAKLYYGEQGFSFPFKIAKLDGWHREMWYNDTGLQWVPPSPNMPTLETATLYSGTCLFEGTNVSEGRGTTKPFEYIGAPWIDSNTWADRLNGYALSGVLFRPIAFTPQFSKYKGATCHGVAIHITDRREVASVEIAVWMLRAVLDAYPNDFEFRETHFDRLAGSASLRQALLDGTPCYDIIDSWITVTDQFRVRREPYLLYENF